ncbi:AIG2 family [Fusarium mexicanum]|uniref:gamma-glutamylcyclotransferase n=1 Tax=Fusarium mexicanum TaxID=751941 RepID=A0A8H5IEK2_9HYPO|nr:AIG2 family [Fusarium mexicanum]
MPDLPAQLYFAYGSNLWLQQMASRCPESYYIGRAVLMDHRWQINSRGFANIIPCSGYNVHGLVYQVSVDDEARLDRNEGVHSGAYTKSYHSVVLHEAVEDLQLPTRYLVQDGGLDKAVDAVRSGSRSHEPEHQGRIRSNVLVYLSSRHSRWGTARDEYVDRMNCDRPFHRGQPQEDLNGKDRREERRVKVVAADIARTPKSLGEEDAGVRLRNAEPGVVHFSARLQPWGMAYAPPREFQDHFRFQPPGRGGGDGGLSCHVHRIYFSLPKLVICHAYVSKQYIAFNPAAPVNVSLNKLVSRIQARSQAAQCGCSMTESLSRVLS